MSPTPTRKTEFPLLLALTGLLVLVGAGILLPPVWLWGLNHGNWLIPPLRIGLPAVGILVIWTPAGRLFGSWLASVLSPSLIGNRFVAYGIVPVCGGLIFWFFRETTHMLGDGQTLAVMLAGDNLFHGFDFMTYHLTARIYQTLGAGGEASAFQITAVISCLCGAVYLGTAAWSARRLTEDPAARILLYVLLVFFTPLEMFFGYMEVYAPLAVALLVFLTFFIEYIENRGRLILVAAAWSTALFFHLNALFLAPLLVFALFRPAPDDKDPLPRRLLIVAGPVLGALLLAAVIFGLAGYDYDRFLADFAHVGQGGGILVPLSGTDGLFSLRHFKDTLNLLLLLVPVPLVLMGLAGRPRSNGSPLPWIFLAGTLYLIALPLFVHMKLGAVRDWDLFAPHMILMVFSGWYAARHGQRYDRDLAALLGPVAIVAMVLAVPWFVLNANADRSLARLEAVSADMSPYAHGLLHEQFAYHHQMVGHEDEVLRHYRRSGEVCPGNPRFHAIYGTYLLNRGEMAAAVAAYDRSVATDSTYVYGLKMALLARVLNRDYEPALEPARRLARLGGQDTQAAEAHGTAAEKAGFRDEAATAFERAAALDPSRHDLRERAAGLHLMQGNYADAENAFRALLEADPARSSAALGLADSIWQDFRRDPDSRSAAEFGIRLEEVAKLIDLVLASGRIPEGNTQGMIAWRDEVRARLKDLDH